MEEIKNKKKLNKKPLLICLAIALVFAVIGFIDIKSNAAEKYSVNVTFDRTTGTENEATNVITFYSISPMQVYVYTSHDVPASQSEKIWGYAFVVSDSKIDDVSAISSVKYTKNGKDFYVMMYNLSFGPYDFQPNSYYDVYSDGGKDIRLKTKYATADDFAQAYINDSLDMVIDYSSFETDDDMPVPFNFKINKIVDKTEIKEKHYDYITWNNSGDYDIQVQSSPWVHVYENKHLGFSYGNYITSRGGGIFPTSDLLQNSVSNYKFEVFDTFYPEMDYIPEFVEYYKNVRKDYPEGNFEKYNNYCSVGYRFRYIDYDNEKVSPWVYVDPDRFNIGNYYYYTVYSDGNFTLNENATGTNSVYTSGTFDDVVSDIEKENQFKKEYQIVDTDIDVQQVTGWLYSVVNFIKGTPQVVGSVLGFLPQPILYGMYVCIFLGIIASGLAIVKALL